AQRRRRDALLFHGTILLGFDLPLIGQALRMPSCEPDYREGRSHETFCRNIPLTPEAVKQALGQSWLCGGHAPPIDAGKVQRLAGEKYSRPDWIHRRAKRSQASE
ncbi:MAG: lipoate--protein ligase family protein, partial [Limisphaerales bacterium]